MDSEPAIRVSKKVKDELDGLKKEMQAHSLSDVVAMLLMVRTHYTEVLARIEDHEQRIKRLEKKG